MTSIATHKTDLALARRRHPEASLLIALPAYLVGRMLGTFIGAAWVAGEDSASVVRLAHKGIVAARRRSHSRLNQAPCEALVRARAYSDFVAQQPSATDTAA